MLSNLASNGRGGGGEAFGCIFFPICRAVGTVYRAFLLIPQRSTKEKTLQLQKNQIQILLNCNTSMAGVL